MRYSSAVANKRGWFAILDGRGQSVADLLSLARGRLEAAALRQVAGHVERGRYPHGTVRFRYALNRESVSRDLLLFGTRIS